MLEPRHPSIISHFTNLLSRVGAEGVDSWLNPEKLKPDLDGLIYLCKFGYFTGVLTKAEIGRVLDLKPPERKELIKSWYDDHREKGCGTC